MPKELLDIYRQETMLTLTNGSDSVYLNADEVRGLELKLNVTSKGTVWKWIGDILYDYHIGRVGSPAVLKVDNEQFLFLLRLRSMSSWRECGGL
jgi:hypothetical protein